MALRFDAAGEVLTRTTSLPPIASFTFMAWVMVVVDNNTYGTVFAFGGTTSNIFHQLGVNATGTTLQYYNPYQSALTGSALTVGTWYHVAVTVAGTGDSQVQVYLNGVGDMTAAGSTQPAANELWIGSNYYTEYWPGRLAAMKVYGAVLTVGEITTEMRYFSPVRYANLNTWLPCVDPVANNNAIDVSGIGGNMTVGGTLSVEAGPPIAWTPDVSWAHGGQDARFAPLIAQ